MDTNNDARTVADIYAQLNKWARARGFQSHIDMANQLESGRAKLRPDQAPRALNELKPVVDDAAMAAAKAAVDATNLPAIQDLQKSVARLVRVLLLGYTDEEREFLQARAFGIRFSNNARKNTIEAGVRQMERMGAQRGQRP